MNTIKLEDAKYKAGLGYIQAVYKCSGCKRIITAEEHYHQKMITRTTVSIIVEVLLVLATWALVFATWQLIKYN